MQPVSTEHWSVWTVVFALLIHTLPMLAMTAIFSSYAVKLYTDAETAHQFYMAFKLGCCAGVCGLIFFLFLTSIRYGNQFQYV
jgi:hypothetical protein